ncbi:hypothetical protein [Commensalibacter papalotli (ex Botero et al. 2024)]|uniref:hypothetical protein n=1 Tax=Commensalibacter papalotli (ex Botero et al. 2024) TaxID=2972766 RepID=UPI0022FFA39D|nr:hypothetical protein [Commensalibacter papalotli (ex Botero et al. 2024)]CAI3958380.1 unnamed protein product [Commensalibacter papalotli (ex Botero et al. 2024)]
MVREKFSAEKEKMNAAAFSDQAQLMIKNMAKLEEDKSLKVVFGSLARKTGLNEGQVKRLYYSEWKVIPVHIYMQVAKAYRKFNDLAIQNMQHKEMILQQRIEQVSKEIEHVFHQFPSA